MTRKHRPSKADRKPVTRRYVMRTVQRARDDIIRAVIISASLEVAGPEPRLPHAMDIAPVSADRLRRMVAGDDA